MERQVVIQVTDEMLERMLRAPLWRAVARRAAINTIVVVGVTYLSFLGYRLLPSKPLSSLSEKYEIGDYLAEVLVAEGSSLVGQIFQFGRRFTEYDFRRSVFHPNCICRLKNLMERLRFQIISQ